MKKTNKKLLAAICCVGVLAVVGCGAALAQSPTVQAGSSQSTEEVGGPGAGAENPELENAETEAGTGAGVPAQGEAGAGADDAGAGMPAQSEAAVGIEDGTFDGTGAEDMQVLDKLCIYGLILGMEDGQIRIDNQSTVSAAGEIVLNISQEGTRVLDAVNGYPVTLTDLKVGDVIYAYIGQAMTMSLPPQTAAELIFCQIPEDSQVPELVRVNTMTAQADGSWELVSTNGVTYTVAADCPITPYLTRNIVVLESVMPGDELILWSDESHQAQKLVLFPAQME